MNWGHIWARVKAVPVGVWAALGAALALLGMYLRGRRLDAELAAERLKTQAADAAARAERSVGRAEVHRDRAAAHNDRAEKLQDEYLTITQAGSQEEKRIAALPPKDVTLEYLRLAQKKKVN